VCGRSTYKLTWEEIVRLYRLTLDQPPQNTQARFNVCPTTTIDTVVSKDDKRWLLPMRWGLVPSWWSKPLKELKLATFNARAETVTDKPFFREAFKRTRCLIPVSGYYQWQDRPGGKQPWYFTARDGSPALTIAGSWDEWRDRASGEMVTYRGIWRAASSSRLRQLLQSHPNAPVLEQGLAGVARHRIIRLHIACANPGRIAPPIRQDLVSDRDTGRKRSDIYSWDLRK
jgi:putative SOS response-associated peptidase YedK